MNGQSLLNHPLYGMPQKEKEACMLYEMNRLTEHHLALCHPYSKIFSALNLPPPPFASLSDVPYLPVGLFKKHDLLSIPREEIYKTLFSSGTTGTRPSTIFLDRKTAQLQTKALASIMAHFLGNERLPLLIIDTEDLIFDRKMFSARGAGVLGMLNFGFDHLYLLDSELRIKSAQFEEWEKKYREVPILIFGFTFMIWKHFLSAIEAGKYRFPQGILIHTGGWKRLHEQAITNSDFKEKLKHLLEVQKCHNFYGMVEQTGSVYMECEHGYFHCPAFGEIIIRNPVDWLEAKVHHTGVIQSLSALPLSYPGHSLLTEDLGYCCGVDDCPCGRLGKYFQVRGRVPKAEPRGCSDAAYL